MMKTAYILAVAILAGCLGSCARLAEHDDWFAPYHNLTMGQLPEVWDEAIPLGNGMTGALVWQKDGRLRIAIDRADLWDLRPVDEFQSDDYSYSFVCRQVLAKKDIAPVHGLIDDRTRLDAAPTKIPAGAIEIDTSPLGKVVHVELDLASAVCHIRWEKGTEADIFTPADEHGGRFLFRNLSDKLSIRLVAPLYEENEQALDYQPGVNKLTSLGYKAGRVEKKDSTSLFYHQNGWGNVSYEIAINWDMPKLDVLEGKYCVTSHGTWYSETEGAMSYLAKNMSDDFGISLERHKKWWKAYWKKSAIHLPDTLLEKQWYLEMYKFASASRKGAPPISLQAVWTADNGQTPPWRGDYHNDLNTQLSYWPGYVSNHLDEASAFTDWLWQIRGNSEAYTRKFFRTDGLNVPCIATLTGNPIGGWSQYANSPTAAGWLAHHFYLQWKYSMDEKFLSDRAYPWVREVARFFESVSVRGKDGMRKLPLSSSPEINDNRLDAWFQETTNYDLANIRLTYTVAAEMAEALGQTDEANRWKGQLAEWPDYAKDETGLLIAPGTPLVESHRHFSHLLAFHPFGLIDAGMGNESIDLILRSLKNIEQQGTDYWTGYTYAWLAGMKARVFDGDEALRNLHIFIKAFCGPNSFHLNGDQLKAGFSQYTYRPFTLEGNFACASAIQEMLLQSHTGVIKVFPAVPLLWKNLSFENLRAMGAFLVTGFYADGRVDKIIIESEKGGMLRLLNPFLGKITEHQTKQGERLMFSLDYPTGKNI